MTLSKYLITRFFITFSLCLVGVCLAVPISYLFQLDIMRVMGFWDYVSYFPHVQLSAATFGAWDIYFNTALVTILALVFAFNVADHFINKNVRQENKPC